MDIVSTSVSFAVGIVAGILIAKAMEQAQNGKIIDKEKLLEDAFGEHITLSTFSLTQAKDWIKAHKDSLDNGAKALVLKITPKALKDLNIDVEISNDMDNYLAIAVVNMATNKMEDSILVKYDELDDKLEELLAKGDGTLVVGG